MKLLNTLLILLFCSTVIAQDTVKACYYRSAGEYIKNEANYPGSLLSHDLTNVSFYYQYTKLNLDSKKIWGYKDNNGNLYRSIDFIFYKMIQNVKIAIFCATIEGVQTYKMASSATAPAVDIDETNVLSFIASNQNLLAKYVSLPKKERKSKALEFIYQYNQEAFASTE